GRLGRHDDPRSWRRRPLRRARVRRGSAHRRPSLDRRLPTPLRRRAGAPRAHQELPLVSTLPDDDVVTRYELRVNGATHTVDDAWLGESLLHVLRERLGLPGAKNACEQGECGSCSVLVDGQLVCSCLVLGAAAVERDIETVESLTDESALPGESALSDVQQ